MFHNSFYDQGTANIHTNARAGYHNAVQYTYIYIYGGGLPQEVNRHSGRRSVRYTQLKGAPTP